jgi:thiamine biosynthesis protein ThiS
LFTILLYQVILTYVQFILFYQYYLKLRRMEEAKTFFVNGEKYYIRNQISILDLLNYFDYNSSLLVLEYNNFICNKKNWDKILIVNNDKIEIVTIVGGG